MDESQLIYGEPVAFGFWDSRSGRCVAKVLWRNGGFEFEGRLREWGDALHSWFPHYGERWTLIGDSRREALRWISRELPNWDCPKEQLEWISKGIEEWKGPCSGLPIV